ncbi:uncharacterized protein EI97DRAFT_479637 [Westerdykella ornata]|uniref:Uncharacterized protein n=1 Tax=Westerdykella ornata TaxID=318751 RepID=A0A6A6JCF8_WESOR|nr:uncharacterized protein EI97DRAFT_479637 [Westerdykella ornata]KAF2273965.1 hypothetical protein EI97DRAFT_479637 [Westerdykella ornata]
MFRGLSLILSLSAASATLSAAAAVRVHTQNDDPIPGSFFRHPTAFHILEFRSPVARTSEVTPPSDVDHNSMLAGLLSIPPASNAVCTRDGECVDEHLSRVDEGEHQETAEATSSDHFNGDDNNNYNNAANETDLRYGAWMDAAAWTLIVYACASLFLLTYLWSIGWLHRIMTVSVPHSFSVYFSFVAICVSPAQLVALSMFPLKPPAIVDRKQPTLRVPGLEEPVPLDGPFPGQRRARVAAPYASSPHAMHAARMNVEMRRWGLV